MSTILTPRVRRSRRLLALAAFLGVLGAPLGAQQVEPQEPSIVLPPVFLNVEDVSQATIQTPLPADTGPALPEISVKLPPAEAPSGAAVNYAPPVPQAAGAAAAGGPAPATSFFSEGTIGAGSSNHVIGDVTLFKLGASPRFSLHFGHERLDGYEPGQQPGAGFFHRNDAVDGSLTAGSETGLSGKGSASYTETEDGMQPAQLALAGISTPYGSVTHRFLDATLSADYRGIAPFSFAGTVTGRSTTTTLSGTTPPQGSELSVAPHLSVSADLPHVSIGLGGDYGFLQTTPLAVQGATAAPSSAEQEAAGELTLRVDLPLSMTLRGNAGLHWDETNGLVYPFSIGLDGYYADLLTWRVEGGYRVVTMSYSDLWSSYPFLTQEIALVPSLSWYGGAQTQWRFPFGLAVEGGLGFETQSAALLPTAPSSTWVGLYGFEQAATYSLKPTLAVTWTPQPPLSLKASWTGSFLSPNAFFPVSSISAGVDLQDRSLRYGGGLHGRVDIYTTGIQVPDLGMSAFFRLTEGIIFNAELNDFLSPWIPGGRTMWGTYATPGFNLLVSTRISL